MGRLGHFTSRVLHAVRSPGRPAGPLASQGVHRRLYETLYERLAQETPGDEAIGDGDFELIGRMELRLLEMEGLQPTDTLVDFGCGIGRLAVHAIPYLVGGHYIGIDISDSMLERAQRRLRRAAGHPPCRVSWMKQTEPVFPVPDGSVDRICAYSVFTHLEHEDTFRYLVDALRIVRPGGRFVLSCLPLNLALARDVFRASAMETLEARWQKVRSVTTSVELFEAIARMAGWTVLRWYPGDEPNIELGDPGAKHAFGQSVCVLEAAEN